MQEKLIHLRQVFGYTQQFMADALRITKRTYQNKEAGTSLFTSEEMFTIAKLFGKNLDDIFLPIFHQIGEKEDNENL